VERKKRKRKKKSTKFKNAGESRNHLQGGRMKPQASSSGIKNPGDKGVWCWLREQPEWGQKKNVMLGKKKMMVQTGKKGGNDCEGDLRGSLRITVQRGKISSQGTWGETRKGGGTYKQSS